MHALEVQNGDLIESKGAMGSNWQHRSEARRKHGYIIGLHREENKALNLFVQSLSSNQLMAIRKEKIAKGIWNALANHHVNKD